MTHLLSRVLEADGLVLGPQKGLDGQAPDVRAGLSWGLSTYAAARLRRAAVLSLHRELALAFGAQMVDWSDDDWVLDVLAAPVDGSDDQPSGAVTFRQAAGWHPASAIHYDSREAASLLEPDAWHDLLTIAPDRPTNDVRGAGYQRIRHLYPYVRHTGSIDATGYPEAEMVHTPDIRTVAQLEELLAAPAAEMIKSLVVICDRGQGSTRPIICALRGDNDLDLNRVARLTGSVTARLATASEVLELTGSRIGYAGPIPTKNVTDVVFDIGCPLGSPVVCGTHREEYHLIGAVAGVDFERPSFTCGISTSTDVEDPDRGFRLLWLRQYYEELLVKLQTDEALPDDRPFQTVVVPARPADAASAMRVAKKLSSVRTSVLVDDRSVTFGSRMTDWDMLRPNETVVVGREFERGLVEAGRGAARRRSMPIEELLDREERMVGQ